MASIASYLSWIRFHENLLEVRTNTACRVASRLLPLLHRGSRISGVPGLRLLDFGVRRAAQRDTNHRRPLSV
ncbi:hypothetical protein [Kitasatospora sp. NPDC001175]|uniref:hypothetical protein n=1 Tax=Kitasatospora sp. NPDC001175 TaxID=3157103 RepID=UPI003D027F4F